MLRGELPADEVLGAVRVLVLVDEDLLPALLVAGEDLRVLLEEEDDAHEQVVEVDGVVLGQLALVRGVHARGRLVVVVRRLLAGGRDVGQLVLALTDPGQHPGRPEALLVEVEVLQHASSRAPPGRRGRRS